MFIETFLHFYSISRLSIRFISGSAQVKLPRPKLILDPRASIPNSVVFDCHYHDDGVTVTLTLLGTRKPCDAIGIFLKMRVYDPAQETIPDFKSTIYRYSGLDDERAPKNTTIAIINPPVKTIRDTAFIKCENMKKCIMHEGVETIGEWAFQGCRSLEYLFLPSSIKKIDWRAFDNCTNIRILSIPINIDISQIKKSIIGDCGTFFQITHIPQYDGFFWATTNHDQVHQAFIDLYRNMPPLHTTCLQVNVSTQTIHDSILAHGTQAASITDHDGMTPLHILSLNPHASVGCMGECLDADMSAAFVGDSRGNTVLDYLREENKLAGHTWLVTALCLHRESMMGCDEPYGGHKVDMNGIVCCCSFLWRSKYDKNLKYS